jgi:hypothetical protein
LNVESINETPETLANRLERAFRLHEKRAIIGLIEVPPALLTSVDAAVQDAMTRASVWRETVRVLRVDGSERSGEDLGTENRTRDLTLRELRGILLLVPDAAGMRFAKACAPDLTAAPDVFAVIRSHKPTPAWGETSEAIRKYMDESCSYLDFTGLLPNDAVRRILPLDKLYISLADFQPERASGHDPVGEGESDLYPTEDARKRGTIVFANPGAGKTTLLRYLAWVYATGRADPLSIGQALPVLVPLAAYSADRERNRVRSLLEFVPDWLSDQGIAGADEIGSHWDEILLLLDGLDEMKDAAGRRALMEEMSSLLEQGRFRHVVMTGRRYLVDEIPEDLTRILTRSRLRAPDEYDVLEYLKQLAELRNRPTENAFELAKRIGADADLRALASTPLMLAFMALLDEVEGRLPDSRIEIYWRLGEILMDRWARTRTPGTSQRSRPTRADMMRILGPIAWWILDRGGGAAPIADIRTELARFEAGRDDRVQAERRAADMLDILSRKTALLVPAQPGDRWAFVHSSVAEYFAAVHAPRDPARWKALLADTFRPELREVVLFAAGYLGRVDPHTERLDELIQTVIEQSRRRGRYHARHPSLVIGLLREEPGLAVQQARRLVRRLFEWWFTTAFGEESKWQVQYDAVRFLEESSRRGFRDTIGSEMRAWFQPGLARIRWERILVQRSAGWSAFLRFRRMSSSWSRLGALVFGRLAWNLPMLAGTYGIDAGELERAMAVHAQRGVRQLGAARLLSKCGIEELPKLTGEFAAVAEFIAELDRRGVDVHRMIAPVPATPPSPGKEIVFP